MASVNSFTVQRFNPITKPIKELKPPRFSFPVKGLSGSSLQSFCKSNKLTNSSLLKGKKRNWVVVRSITEEFDVIPVQSNDLTDQQDGVVAVIEREMEVEKTSQVDVFVNEGRLSLEGGVGEFNGFSSSPSSSATSEVNEEEDFEKLIDRSINATIVLAAGTFAITKLLTIDSDYWHGWTLYEIIRYAPQHNWTAYEEALKTNPVLAKMMISGVVYSLGDWIAQCYEGKPLFEFDRARMFRSGLVGFSLHGSLSHYYYQFCEALFPFQDWWVVPAKVAFDQTVWSAVWNSIYYTVLGLLRFESPASIVSELSATFWPMLTAGWKLWPFAHLITYGVIPLEQRLLWVDCVELIWVTILSTYSNEKSEARQEASLEPNSISQLTNHPEKKDPGNRAGQTAYASS
ncbi:Mpv17/PMP22 [Macleaya cordata]|uniref:Mpv17/PMP22 n=1 Tax=Macleaya cordata TaxID=56857 RepID=A0A200QRX9_MACCD|nr:Mpv17/PMP22 [Macleaya cordata]